VIFADADLERALDAAVFMIFSNNGELPPARASWSKAIYRSRERFVERAKRIAIGDPLDEKTIVGPMISRATSRRCAATSPSAARRARPCLRRRRRAGAAGSAATGQLRPATVFADVDNRMRIAQEEIFGPVACLILFDGEADAIAQANDIAYGLSSYV
jgi:5-carboxymethyl-2-hydroxymuconic-semialdehyde dehydrogenase